MARSEAQKRADKKYAETHEINYTTIGMRVEKKKAEIIKEQAVKQGVSPSKFLLLAATYCIENNIDFKNE
ncbi:MAG: hypothetical protein IJZ65_06970 [Ruminiclostridium sp.]|nr:hypothetical protein [Ruminiclostridium sp.]